MASLSRANGNKKYVCMRSKISDVAISVLAAVEDAGAMEIGIRIRRTVADRLMSAFSWR